MFNQHVNNVIRLKSLTVRLKRRHNPMSEDGVRDRFDIFGRDMETSFQNGSGFGAQN